MPFWGPIIGAAIGVFGGLSIQRKQEKAAREAEARNQQYLEDSKQNDFSKTVQAAEKAGINPLTAVRSGAGNYQSNRAIMPSMSGYQFALEAMSQGARSAISYAETYKERALEALFKTYQIGAMQMDINLAKAQIKGLGKKDEKFSVPLTHPITGKPILDRDGQPAMISVDEREVIPKYKYVYNQNTGKIFPLLNPELTESGPTELLTGYLMMEGLESGKTEVTIPGTLLTPEFKLGFPMNPKGYGLSGPGSIYGLPEGSRYKGRLRFPGWD